MSAADRLYRQLLRAYPARFRAEYGREMLLLFRDQRRAGDLSPPAFWCAQLWDVARTAPALRLEAARGNTDNIQPGGETMRPMTMLAMLVGALEVVNSAIEGWLGGVVGGAGYSLAVGVMGMAAGALLLASGIALLRHHSPRAVTRAQTAAVVCLLVFVQIGVIGGRMSLFATILGIAFPVAYLLVLRRASRQGPGAPLAV